VVFDGGSFPEKHPVGRMIERPWSQGDGCGTLIGVRRDDIALPDLTLRP